ncbi:MAG: hypothetical protein CVU98_06790 [Firmicutes bacterium HGW-Firmicutes-3]|nr:MAG: hypothetical protein CVU98_06790 [Firmicutes bacterium HGW-Firmicutes-3]
MKKQVILFVIIIISIIALAFIGIKLIIKNNYDLRIITDDRSTFFIFSSSQKEYYLVNSSLGKVKTKPFDINSSEITDAQLKQIKEIEGIDSKFSISGRDDYLPYKVFFYENYIFYTRYSGVWDPSTVSEEDRKDFREYIYKYDLDTKELEQIKVQLHFGARDVSVKREALIYIYPQVKQAILEKIGKGFDYNDIYYGNGRILFTTYNSSSRKGTREYLFEYIPVKNETRKILFTTDSIYDVDVMK